MEVLVFHIVQPVVEPPQLHRHPTPIHPVTKSSCHPPPGHPVTRPPGDAATRSPGGPVTLSCSLHHPKVPQGPGFLVAACPCLTGLGPQVPCPLISAVPDPAMPPIPQCISAHSSPLLRSRLLLPLSPDSFVPESPVLDASSLPVTRCPALSITEADCSPDVRLPTHGVPRLLVPSRSKPQAFQVRRSSTRPVAWFTIPPVHRDGSPLHPEPDACKHSTLVPCNPPGTPVCVLPLLGAFRSSYAQVLLFLFAGPLSLPSSSPSEFRSTLSKASSWSHGRLSPGFRSLGPCPSLQCPHKSRGSITLGLPATLVPTVLVSHFIEPVMQVLWLRRHPSLIHLATWTTGGLASRPTGHPVFLWLRPSRPWSRQSAVPKPAGAPVSQCP